MPELLWYGETPPVGGEVRIVIDVPCHSARLCPVCDITGVVLRCRQPCLVSGATVTFACNGCAVSVRTARDGTFHADGFLLHRECRITVTKHGKTLYDKPCVKVKPWMVLRTG